MSMKWIQSFFSKDDKSPSHVVVHTKDGNASVTYDDSQRGAKVKKAAKDFAVRFEDVMRDLAKS